MPKIQPLPHLPVIDDEDQGVIGRSIKYLTGYSDPGGHPEDTARIIKDVGDYGIAYARELVSQLQQADTDLGDKYLISLAGLLSSDLQEKFLGGPMPENIPIGVSLAAVAALAGSRNNKLGNNRNEEEGRPEEEAEYDGEDDEDYSGDWGDDGGDGDYGEQNFDSQVAEGERTKNLAAWLDEQTLNNLAELGRRQVSGEFEQWEVNSGDDYLADNSDPADFWEQNLTTQAAEEFVKEISYPDRAWGEVPRRPDEVDEENGVPYFRGEMPPPLPERTLPEREAPAEDQEDQPPRNDPREAFDRTLFPGHGENNLRDEFDHSLFNDDLEGQIKEQNKPGYRKLLTDYDRPPPKIDMDKFADTLNENALPKSKEECAAYVRRALEKAGADTRGRPGQAKNWGPTLERNGFVILDKNGYTPQKGDIVVIQPYKPYPDDHGHIAAYDGKQWISDYKQRDFWGGDGYRTKRPPYEFYRQLPY